MASVRPEGHLDDYWQIRYRDRSRSPSETTDSLWKKAKAPSHVDGYTHAEAEDEASWRQHLYDRDRYDPWTQDGPGAPVVQETLTVGDAVERYVEEKREAGRRGEARGWSEKTYSSDAPVLKQFARHVGQTRLARKIRPQELRSWVYREDLAPTTKFTRWSKLCAMIRYWESRGWIAEMPRLPGRPEQKRRVRVTITPDQLETICEAYGDLRERKIETHKHTTVFGQDWYTDAWKVYLYQGFRRSELLEVRVRDIDLQDEMVRVGPEQKKGQGTLIPLVAPARGVLEPYLEGRNPTDRVFSTPSGNRRVSDHFREAVDHAALSHEDFSELSAEDVEFEPLREDPSDIDLYTLRHSCCTYWLRQKRRLIWVNHLMRHESIETTMEYVHLLPTDLREMYSGIGNE